MYIIYATYISVYYDIYITKCIYNYYKILSGVLWKNDLITNTLSKVKMRL